MRTIERACVALLFVALSACSGGSAPTAAQPAPPPAELVEGDLRIIATIVPTTALQERVTRGYGIARGEGFSIEGLRPGRACTEDQRGRGGENGDLHLQRLLSSFVTPRSDLTPTLRSPRSHAKA